MAAGVSSPLPTRVQWLAITGEEPPTAKHSITNGLPWFGYCGDDLGAIEGTAKLKGITGPAKRLMPRASSDSERSLAARCVNLAQAKPGLSTRTRTSDRGSRHRNVSPPPVFTSVPYAWECRIWLRKSFVRSLFGFLKNSSGGACSTI